MARFHILVVDLFGGNTPRVDSTDCTDSIACCTRFWSSSSVVLELLTKQMMHHNW